MYRAIALVTAAAALRFGASRLTRRAAAEHRRAALIADGILVAASVAVTVAEKRRAA